MDIEMIVAFLITFLFSVIGYILILLKSGKVEDILLIIKSLVDEAEEKFGSGTGDIKYKYVVTKIKKMLPKYLTMFISNRLLDLWITIAVDELQEKLNKRIEEEKREAK